MKASPKLQKAQANMAEGLITADGFLGKDDRELIDIITEDEEMIRRNGLDLEEIGKTLMHLMEEGKKGLGEPVTVEEKWLVQTFEARGFLACPFEDGIFEKVSASIENKTNKTKVLVSQLSVHLLRKHHFLQGEGSPFRLKPGTLKDLLA